MGRGGVFLIPRPPVVARGGGLEPGVRSLDLRPFLWSALQPSDIAMCPLPSQGKGTELRAAPRHQTNASSY